MLIIVLAVGIVPTSLINGHKCCVDTSEAYKFRTEGILFLSAWSCIIYGLFFHPINVQVKSSVKLKHRNIGLYTVILAVVRIMSHVFQGTLALYCIKNTLLKCLNFLLFRVGLEHLMGFVNLI